jgi:hypothetical protein
MLFSALRCRFFPGAAAMNEEILRIQKMVAEGKITAEESVELLETVRRGASIPAVEAASSVVPSQPTKDADRRILGIIALVTLFLGIFITPFPAIIMGFIAWRSIFGKIAAVGGLVLLALMGFMVLLFFSLRQSV